MVLYKRLVTDVQTGTFGLDYELKNEILWKKIFVQSIAYCSRNYDLFYNETRYEMWSQHFMFFNLIRIL